MHKFWMCWVEGRGFPIVQHPTKREAEEEAERLVLKERRPVVILVADEYCTPPTDVTWHEMEPPRRSPLPASAADDATIAAAYALGCEVEL